MANKFAEDKNKIIIINVKFLIYIVNYFNENKCVNKG